MNWRNTKKPKLGGLWIIVYLNRAINTVIYGSKEFKGIPLSLTLSLLLLLGLIFITSVQRVHLKASISVAQHESIQRCASH